MYYFRPFFLFMLLLFIFFSCDNYKRNFNGIEITIEKKRIDAVNFEAKVVVRNKYQTRSKDNVYILIDKESKLDSQIKNIKEKYLNNKEVSN